MALLLISIFLVLVFLHIMRRRKSTRPEIDGTPLLPKWLVRLIWLGSIAFFQIFEFQRYLGGQSYRPFFGLYAAVIFAAVVWFAVRGFADLARQRQARFRSPSAS
jgi:ABC-type transport system involved in cytochrome c biogenesis permease subunit